MDDDDNGLTDCDDPACAGNRACREQMCGDGTDDDGDGATDCDDADCAFFAACDSGEPPPQAASPAQISAARSRVPVETGVILSFPMLMFRNP